ncbi:hypothetical protein BB561_004204 [Smittium simulii]|uniref:General transcription and DNA repair factor IIH n=1 Tax=Smittium simulii TaxID=133385 RepID=A0A2T9YHJ2_9FUNG|nr:hypothetical protein BB561_004204 [Smittium simulii]
MSSKPNDAVIDLDEQLLKEQEVGYTWEEEYKRSWDTLQEDENGSLQNAVATLNKKLKLKRKIKDKQASQRGLLRYCYIVFDCSTNTSERDLRPSRLELTLQVIEAFVLEFFEQNPLSQLGIIVVRDGLAKKLTELSSNPTDHIKALRDKQCRDPSGSMSLQNALLIAMNILRQVPNYGSREIFGILGSLTSNDPGDINQTISEIKNEKIRISIVQMAAEVQLFKKACTLTGGVFSVAMNEIHFRELVLNFIIPPPILLEMYNTHLVEMGFSIRVYDQIPTFCSCHHKLTLSGYLCPRCKSKVCSLPVICGVCQLSLIVSPHLSRSYHHLFPTISYKEISTPEVSINCDGCLDSLVNLKHNLSSGGSNFDSDTTRKHEDVFQCPNCKKNYCLSCDIFIHETLHNCPGCVNMSNSLQN